MACHDHCAVHWLFCLKMWCRHREGTIQWRHKHSSILLWRHKLSKCFCDMIKKSGKNKTCLKSCQICKHKQYFWLNLIYFFTLLHIHLCSVLVQFLHQLIFDKILSTLFNHSLKYLNNLNLNNLRGPCAISLALATTNQLDWVIFNISEQCSEILKRNPV